MEELLREHTVAAHALAAAGSVAIGTALTYPFDSVKVLLQVGAGSRNHFTPFQVVNRVQNLSGISGLCRGIGWLVPGRIFGMGARFGVYEILTAFCKDGRADNYVYVSEAMMAGIAAGAVESVVCSPFEIVKLRSQVTSAIRMSSSASVAEHSSISPLIARLLSRYSLESSAFNNSVGLLSTLNTKFPSMIDRLREYPWMMTGSGRPPSVADVRWPSAMFTLEGLGTFWRGLRPGLVRDSVFGGIFFSSWEFLHQAMLDWKAVGMKPPPRSDDEIGPLSPLAVSLAAGFSGSIAAAASHGFDTAKTRAQCVVLPKYISKERKLLKWARPGKFFERLTGIHPTDRNVLSRGIWMRMARSGVATFVMVGSYYWVIDHMVP